MDDITHALTGALLAKATISNKEQEGKIAVRAFWVSALAPDADFFLRAFGFETYILYHRGITHSLFGLPLLALLLGWLFYRFSPLKRFGYLTFLCACGIACHIFLDLITSYGTMILAPFSDCRFSLDWVFIIDPFFTSIVALPLLFGCWKGEPPKKLYRGALFLLFAYLSVCAINHHRALETVKKAAHTQGITYLRADAFPQPFSPFRWMGIVEESMSTYRTWLGLSQKEKIQFQSFSHERRNRYIEKTEQLELIRLYRWFARYPVVSYREKNDRHVIEYFDLRFSLRSLGLKRRPFIMQVIMDEQGKVLSQGFNR